MALSGWGNCLLFPACWMFIFMEVCLNFVKCLSWIFWDDYVLFPLYPITMTYYTDIHMLNSPCLSGLNSSWSWYIIPFIRWCTFFPRILLPEISCFSWTISFWLKENKWLQAFSPFLEFGRLIYLCRFSCFYGGENFGSPSSAIFAGHP